MPADGLREVTVNGVRYFQAADVERWHRQLLARAEYFDGLEEENARLREVLELIAGGACLPACVEGPPTCGCEQRRAVEALGPVSATLAHRAKGELPSRRPFPRVLGGAS